MPSEGEDLLNQRLGPPGGQLDLVQAGGGWMVGAQVEPGQVHVPEDGAEDVVEVMGDPAGQGSKRLHSLRLAELDFELALAGNVAGDGGVAKGLVAERMANEKRGEGNVDQRA